MKKIILIALTIITAILSYQVDSFEFFLLGFSLLIFFFLLILGVIRLFRKVNFKYFKTPLLIMGICIIGVIISLFRPYEKPLSGLENLSEKLEYAYKTDQNDRKQLRSFVPLFSKLEQRDEQRLALVKDLYNNNRIKQPLDKFYAAFIFHHSDKSKDYQIASELATDAANSKKLQNHYQAQWLKKAAYDRWMVSIGKPEKYKTQGSFSIDLE